MNQSFSLPTALCLPVPDIEALIQGQTIAVLPEIFLRPGQRFYLYPVEISTVEIDKHYRTNFLPIAKTAWKKFHKPGILLQPQQLNLIETDQQLQLPLSQNNVLIKSWAKCELCRTLDKTESLDILSQLTIWKQERFDEILQNRPHFFLAYLRVYHLDKPLEIPAIPNIQEKLGKFAPLPNNISVSEAKPVLSDQVFNQRKQQLENRQTPLHPELEELQSLLLPIANNNPAAQQLEQEIRVFLGWNNQRVKHTLDPDLTWIKNIAKVGNSSDGNEFEKLVRKSLIKLGFSSSNTNTKANLDSDKLGGAGGLDFYCEYPYPVIGECKATKTEKVVDSTVAQLVKLGLKHLQEEYNSCIKIIMAAGKLATDTEKTAQGNKMNVIRPETLQKLVTLKAKHPGSIDLLNLKQDLEKKPFGEEADDKINKYIDKVEQEIKLRSHIIQVVKEMTQLNNQNNVTVIEIRTYYNAIYKSNLTNEIVQEILIELSSPLTGYLGRIKEDDWTKDRFYYLRDLAIN
jgi:hypothetical protein